MGGDSVSFDALVLESVRLQMLVVDWISWAAEASGPGAPWSAGLLCRTGLWILALDFRVALLHEMGFDFMGVLRAGTPSQTTAPTLPPVPAAGDCSW